MAKLTVETNEDEIIIILKILIFNIKILICQGRWHTINMQIVKHKVKSKGKNLKI